MATIYDTKYNNGELMVIFFVGWLKLIGLGFSNGAIKDSKVAHLL